MPRAPKTTQYVVRFPPDLVVGVDRALKRMKATSDPLRVTRSDAIRSLVRLGLDADTRRSKSR